MKRIERLRSWLDEEHPSIFGILLDIDGTLVRGGRVLPGARELITDLDGQSMPYLLVTNDANHSHAEKAAALHAAGLDIPEGRIVSSGDVIAETVRERGLSGRRVFVMGDLGDPDYAVEAGLEVTRDIRELGGCAGVIVGEDNYDWQPTFNAVINFFIAHPQAPFVVPNPDVYWPDSHGTIAIGAGGKAQFIVSVLEDYGVSVAPEYLGKPYGAVFHYGRSRLIGARGRDPESDERIVMVGDSLKGDILGANEAGFLSVLTPTGITTREQIAGLAPDSPFRPSLFAAAL